MQPDDISRALGPKLGDGLLSVEAFPGTAGRVRFHREAALPLFHAVHDELGFEHLTLVGGIDWVDHREVFYVLWSDAARQYLFLSADVPAGTPHIESASSVWPSANWHERETWEMVDITFDHHPDLRHLLMPDGYTFHPLLRSFKLHEPEELEVKSRHV
ncbi:MAG TPA: NADH-quinone oxidoreductase subunit C [Thermoplasmata archaeon]|nr:NADH-quinone oxidoreductase subunit C [Thermoplasmata archaeon]